MTPPRTAIRRLVDRWRADPKHYSIRLAKVRCLHVDDGRRPDALASATLFRSALHVEVIYNDAPDSNLRLLRDKTFGSGAVIGALVFAAMIGSMFLLPAFESLPPHRRILPRQIALVAMLPRTCSHPGP